MIHHAQTHMITITSTPMMPPKTAATMVGVPSDWSTSGAMATLPVAECVLISTDPVDSCDGSARDHY